MKTAYLYIRVSTDEQKRKGFSLPEQEDRLLKYCAYNNIEVKGIFREDYSAKNFNRPEWKKLIATIRSKSPKQENNILFIKWDRFSRNIEYAYEMIGMLRKYKTTAMAIDQPIDFSVPESTVMLAVYLSVPEAENSRRALNTANGIRRAKQMGRYPSKAPIGFINITTIDGKKMIVPKQPEAGIIRWIFHQLSKNIHQMEEIRRAACEKGLICSKGYFSKIVRNPAYCGLIPLKINAQEQYMVKGIHDPIIPEALFHEVQLIINTKRRMNSRKDELQAMFFLTGLLTCPLCGRKLCGSFSQGSTRKHPYYHCRGRCKTRIKAPLLNDSYEQKLQQLILSSNAIDLFNEVLDDWNVNTQNVEHRHEKKQIIRKLKEQELTLSQARKLFVAAALKIDDYTEMKKEYQTNSKTLKRELQDINNKLSQINKQRISGIKPMLNMLKGFSDMDTTDKKHIANLIPPIKIDFKTGELSLDLGKSLSKILFQTIKHNRSHEFYR